MRKTTIAITGVALLACVLGASLAPTARAQGCEYPLFIQLGAVDANVLILFDSSGSMDTPIYHPDYDQSVTYSGGLNSGSNYSVGSDGYYSAADFRSGEPSTPTAPLVDSDVGERASYPGNYLNWIFYNATDAQRAALPQATRIQVAKPAVNNVIDSNPAIRFGLFRYNGSQCGLKLADLGADHATIKTTVSAIAGSGYTPIAESMVSVWGYLTTDVNAIQYACQNTFLVVVTDGHPTRDVGPLNAGLPNLLQDFDGDGNDPGDCTSLGSPDPNSNDCSDYMDDVAWYMRNNDARADLDGDQFVYTYTVGFGVDARILQETADNGGGIYVNATNPQQLNQALATILRDIVAKVSTGSAVAVVSTEGQTQDLLFRGKFHPGSWRGFLEAFELPYEENELPVWEAGALLQSRSASSREIYTSVGGAQIDFTDGSAPTLRPYLGAADDAEAAELINWARGDDVVGLRDRNGWKLGDIIDSSPLVVGPPRGFRLDNDYLTWRDSQQGRERVLYIGGNDAMIHCFAEATGQEKWAFIPESQLGRLPALADSGYCHQYFCNLTPRAFDAYLGGSWRTVLLCGMKQGGDSYLALDVTDPSAPQLMWETQLADMVESWAAPEIAYAASEGGPIAFLGTGPDDINGRAYLKAISLEDGSEIYSALLSDNAGTDINMATAARSLDADFDGWHDLIYVSDLMGNVWRLDLNASPWDMSLLFDSGGTQPIQAQPILTVDYNNDVFLYFGTGRYLVNGDLTDTSLNTFYSVIDKHDGATVTKSDMVDETTTITPVGPNDRGWFIDLVEGSGERVVDPDALVAGIVYFTSFAPSTQPCSAGGHSWLYKVDFRNGSGDDGDDDDSNDTTDNRIEDLGDGIATKPVVDVVNEEVIVQGSDTRIHVRDADGSIQWVTLRSWRQRYN
jgi:type IV pilus assembly protein PilY1